MMNEILFWVLARERRRSQGSAFSINSVLAMTIGKSEV
jgi:hypothetical protein